MTSMITFCSYILAMIMGFTGQDRKVLVFQNATYEAEIRTVIVYPDGDRGPVHLRPAVTSFTAQDLVLEFDDLVQDAEDYRVKLIACNADWTQSDLRTLDYLFDYNEFNIRQYEFSVDVKLSYVHYTFRLPRVKRPGNYLLVAYRGDDESDIILSHRIMIYGNEMNVGVISSLNGLTSVDRKRQQIDFMVGYGKLEMRNPLEQVKVVIRQNRRWDNAISLNKPSFVREVDNELEYRFFNFENAFYAGTEYRFFDMRSLQYPGQNVATVNRQQRPVQVQLGIDPYRGTEAYSRIEDLNGGFVISNTDTGNGVIESDYVEVTFRLEAPEKIPGQVYVVGHMNNFNSTPANQMRYNEASGMYQGTLLLKQGWYNYKYEVKSDSVAVNYFEGDHYEAENQYEIFVYYDPLTERGEYLMGYSRVTLNSFQ